MKFAEEWEMVKEGLKQLELETRPLNFIPNAQPGKNLLDHVLFAHALRLIMERMEKDGALGVI